MVRIAAIALALLAAPVFGQTPKERVENEVRVAMLIADAKAKVHVAAVSPDKMSGALKWFESTRCECGADCQCPPGQCPNCKQAEKKAVPVAVKTEYRTEKQCFYDRFGRPYCIDVLVPVAVVNK